MKSPELRDYAKARRKLFREWLAEQKTECAICGERDHRCLVFHHRDPKTKSFQIAQNAWGRSRQALEAEVAKCDVLCANCHQRLHYISLDD